MIKKIIFVIILGLLYINNYAQSDSLILSKNAVLKVDSILIEGNNITKDFVIFRELTIKPGDLVSGATVDYNSERVFSLGLFNKVILYFNKQQNPEKNNLVIHVEESWYIYPIPFVQLRDKDLSRSSYGLYITYKNFRGRNEEIKTKISLGYDPTYYVEYYNPLIIESWDISFSTALTYQTILNKSKIAEKMYGEEFSYKYRKVDFIFGKRLNPFNTVYSIFGFKYLDAPADINKNILASNSSIDRVFSAGLSYVRDTRDLKQFAGSGIYGSASLTHFGFGIKNISYNILYADYRQYQNVISNFILKWRGTYRHTFGENIPFYDQSYLGNGEYVRGHKNDLREGNNSILSSVELVYPVVKNWNISLDLPLLPKKLTSARVGIYLSSFADAGIIYNNGDRIKIPNFDAGYGVGMTILVLPFNAIRFEYAFNKYKKSEFILGTGFSF
ncbi:MAG: POTRA domain-containing protein [bacterium]